MLLLVLLAAAAVFGGGWIVFEQIVYEGPRAAPAVVAAPAAAPAAEPATTSAVASVVTVAGAAERGVAGRWSALRPGDTLAADESIRTRRNARVEVSLGQRSHFAVAESSELTIRELKTAAHRLRVTRGQISVDYQADGSRVLKVENARGDAMAEATSARFSVLATGVSFAVATETGLVNLRAGGVAVDVAEGQQSVARDGAPPDAPTAIPKDVLLKVAAASRLGTPGRCAPVEGRVARGCEVFADGEAVRVEPDGRFHVAFALAAERRRKLLLVVRDPSGRTRSRSMPCDEDHADVSVEWKR